MRFVTYPKKADANSSIRRFEPAWWTVDFPISMMATAITTGADALRMQAVFRLNTDLMGLIWETEDRDDAGTFAYPRRKDYRGCVLEFDWASSGIRQMDKLQSVTLTVETYEGPIHYVRLWNYATSGTPDACHIRLELNENTLSGYHADAFVPWHDVKRLFISLQPSAAGRGDCSLAASAAEGASSIQLNVGDSGPIEPGDQIYILGLHPDIPFLTATTSTSGAVQNVGVTPNVATGDGIAMPGGTEVFVQTAEAEQIGESAAQVDLTNVTVTGTNSTLPIRTTPIDAHELALADGFDNAYPFTPERLAGQIHALGYRDFYVLYMGISKFHSLSWDAGEGRYIVDPAKPELNAPSVQWLTDFFARMHALGFKLIVSVSFEILGMYIPDLWNQRDYDGNLARTGWVPPSGLIRPTSQDGLDYLRDVFLATLALLPVGAEKHFQIGEPWWWDGSFGNHAPHIYDAGTLALYNSETGLFAPMPYLDTIFGQPDPMHLPYLQWCRDKLGEATDFLRDEVLAAHPTATSYLLIFSPQILRDDAPMLRTLNFPEDDWKAPAFDVLQIEEYDWTVAGLHADTVKTWFLAIDVLGYPAGQVQYFAGFNLLPSTAWIWRETDKAIMAALEREPQKVFVWSREQVMRDGWLFDHQSWKVYPDCTTLAMCWRIERTDGQIEGYTSFDRTLNIGGVDYEPVNSFTASQLSADVEMSVADVEMVGGIDADGISGEELLAGVYDDAEIEMFVIDWADLSIPKTIVRRGETGTITEAGGEFTAELRGLGQRIQQPVIDVYSAECRVDVYSPKCGVNRATFAVNAEVTALTDGSLGAVADNRVFRADDLTQEDGWFDYGDLVWTSGANTGRSSDVRAQIGGQIELWEPLGLDIEIGDTFTIHAGCDKRCETCFAKFNNVVNFRGEPFVPGADAMLDYPRPGG